MTVQDLITAGNLVPRDEPYDWGRAERVLEVTIPEDYRRLVEAGGAGQWFGHVRLFAPDHVQPSQDLLGSSGVFRDLLVLWEDDPETRPADLPADSRLIAWANTANGETLFWRVDPGTPADARPVYVEDADGESWQRFDLSTTAFLRGLMDGEVDAFPEGTLQPDRVFEPYPEHRPARDSERRP